MEPLTLEEIQNHILATNFTPKTCDKCKGRKFGWDDMGSLIDCDKCQSTGLNIEFTGNNVHEEVCVSP